MRRLSKILFATLIALSFVAGSLAMATPRNSQERHRRHRRGYKHTGKRIGRGGKRLGQGVGHAGRKTGRKIKHAVT
jgi:hypothetical protein